MFSPTIYYFTAVVLILGSIEPQGLNEYVQSAHRVSMMYVYEFSKEFGECTYGTCGNQYTRKSLRTRAL